MRFITKSGEAWELPQEQLQRWAEVYTGIAVERECEKAAVWLEANPSRRKTARGMLRFLVAWLNRATTPQNGARVNQASTAGAYRPHVCPHVPVCPDGSTRVSCQQRTIFGDDRWVQLYPNLAGRLKTAVEG